MSSGILTALALIVATGALSGTAFSLRIIGRRRRALHSAKNDPTPDPLLVSIARTNLVTETNRLATQSALFLVGVLALVPDPPDWLRAVLRFLLVAAVVLIYANSFLADRAEVQQGRLAAKETRERGGESP